MNPGSGGWEEWTLTTEPQGRREFQVLDRCRCKISLANPLFQGNQLIYTLKTANHKNTEITRLEKQILLIDKSKMFSKPSRTLSIKMSSIDVLKLVKIS